MTYMTVHTIAAVQLYFVHASDCTCTLFIVTDVQLYQILWVHRDFKIYGDFFLCWYYFLKLLLCNLVIKLILHYQLY